MVEARCEDIRIIGIIRVMFAISNAVDWSRGQILGCYEIENIGSDCLRIVRGRNESNCDSR